MTSEGGEINRFRKNVANNKTAETTMKQPVPGHIRAGRILFARCRGQPFHISRILMVDTIRLRCYMRFEDGLTHWCRFSNIQNLGSNEFNCCLCHEAAASSSSSSSSSSSCVVSCVQCKLAFHPECHNPPLDVQQLNASRRWLCRVCIFSDTSVINGLPKKTESSATSSPRNTSSNSAKREVLDWDEKHQTNKQNIYCYCRKPGRWSDSMLQCLKCFQWFHYACINSLKTKPLSGDVLFVFVCSGCVSSGHEYLRRIQIKWLHIVQLALYHLERERNAAERKKEALVFFDVSKDILPWIQKNWKQLLPGTLKGYPKDKRESRVIAVLKNHPKKFLKCSSQRKNEFLWRLKKHRSPVAPKIWLPDNGSPLTAKFIDRVLSEMGVKCAEQGRSDDKNASKDSTKGSQPETAGLEKIGTNVETNCSPASAAGSSVRNSRKPGGQTATATTRGTDTQGAPMSSLSNRIDHLLTYRIVNGFTYSNETGSSSPSVGLQDSDSGGIRVSNSRHRLTAFKSNAARLRKGHRVGDARFSHFGKTRIGFQKSSADLLLGDRVSGDRDRLEILRHAAKVEDIAKALKHPKNVVDKEAIDEISNCEVSMTQLKSSVGQYFGATSRLARGERCRILGRRTTSDGLLQYHVEWEGGMN